MNDVALDELPEDRVHKAIALHPCPQLELVRWDGDEVEGHVVAGEGVHPGSALPGVDLVELVLDRCRAWPARPPDPDRSSMRSRASSSSSRRDWRATPRSSRSSPVPLSLHEALSSAQRGQFLAIVLGPRVVDLASMAPVLVAPDEGVHAVPDLVLFLADLGVQLRDRVPITSVPLNIMCSKKWLMPVIPGRSFTDPTLATQPAVMVFGCSGGGGGGNPCRWVGRIPRPRPAGPEWSGPAGRSEAADWLSGVCSCCFGRWMLKVNAGLSGSSRLG